MAIFYNYTITVNGDKAKMDKNIYLYRKNKNIDYYFTIKNACFKFEDEINYVVGYNAQFARFRIVKPDGTNFFTKKSKVIDGKVKFCVTEDLIDEPIEVGTYIFQIDLYDNDDGFVTIPPVYNQFHVLEPLFEEDEVAKTDIGKIDVNYLSETLEEVTIFDENGKYIKTIWKTKDIISTERMNKIEEGIEGLSEKIINKDGIVIVDTEEAPTNEDYYWLDNSAPNDLNNNSTYEGIINELFSTINSLKNRIVDLEKKVEILSVGGIVTGGDCLQLEDGQMFQLEDGEFLELE